MSADKHKRRDRAFAMMRELNRRTWFYGSTRLLPTISSRPGRDMAYAIERGLVKVYRRYQPGSHRHAIGRTVVDTGFFDGVDQAGGGH